MDSIFIQSTVVAIGLVLLIGIYIGFPGKGPRSGVVAVAIVIAAALVLAAVDRFTH